MSEILNTCWRASYEDSAPVDTVDHDECQGEDNSTVLIRPEQISVRSVGP